MTINEMIKEMEKNMKEIREIALDFKYKQPEKKILLDRCMKYYSEWGFYLTQRVITNYRKPQIEGWYKQSRVALRHAKRIHRNVFEA